jgi:hypothetical protein
MSSTKITHVGPNGRGDDEAKAQRDFAQALIDAAKAKQAEMDAKKEKGKK